MAKKPKPPGKKYNYMDTYGDLVTLLLCFFVLLFSMSSVEENKYNALVEALSQQFGTVDPTNLSFVDPSSSAPSGSALGADTPTGTQTDADVTLPSDLVELKESIQSYIEESGMQGQVQIEEGPSGAVFLRLSANLLFAGDSFDLSNESRLFLDYFSECLNSIEPSIMQVKFNGHTGSIEGSITDDWTLSANRAGIVSSYVANTGGFNRFKIAPAFYGRNYPIADNATPEGLAENRRVDIVVLGNDAANLELTLMDAMRMYFPSDDTQYFEGDVADLPDTMIDSIAPLAEEGENVLEGLTSEQLDALAQQAASMSEQNGRQGSSTASAPASGGASGANSNANNANSNTNAA